MRNLFAHGLCTLFIALPTLASLDTQNTLTKDPLVQIREADTDAVLFQQGQQYLSGKTVGQDSAAALKLFLRAAEHGYIAAQYYLAGMYEAGNGVAADSEEATRWYRLAAEQGDAKAQLQMGYRYASGQIGPENMRLALKWYRLASDQDDAIAQFNMGIAYWNGHGMSANHIVAYALYSVSYRNDPSDSNNAKASLDYAFQNMTVVEQQIAGYLTIEMEKPGNVLKAMDQFLSTRELDGALDYRQATVSLDVAATSDNLNRIYHDVLNGIWAGDATSATKSLNMLITSAQFTNLPSPARHQILMMAGLYAYDRKNMLRAHALLLQSSALPEANALDWSYLASAAAKHRDCLDALLALTRLLHASSTMPTISDDRIFDVLLLSDKAPGIPEARVALLDALDALHWQAKADTPAREKNLRNLVRLLLAEGAHHRAAIMAAAIEEPAILLSMRADRQFDELVRLDPAHYDIDHAIGNHIALLRTRSQKQPRSLGKLLELTYALNQAHQCEQTLPMLDRTIALMNTSGDDRHYDDLDHQFIWVLNERSRTLRCLGRWDEAAQQLSAASKLDENGRSNVSQAINLGSNYTEMNRPDDALSALATLGILSPYGKMQRESVRLRAGLEMKSPQLIDESLHYLRTHQSDAPTTFIIALVKARLFDEAVASLEKELEDEDTRTDVLALIQDYTTWPKPNASVPWINNQRNFLSQDDVKTLIARYGRIEHYAISDD